MKTYGNIVLMAVMHCHLLGIHGPAASKCSPYHNGRIPAKWNALVQLVDHQCLQALACTRRHIATGFVPARQQLVELHNPAQGGPVKKLLLAGCAVLLLTTGAVHAGPTSLCRSW